MDPRAGLFRERIASAYNPRQYRRILLAMGIVFGAYFLFPDDFSYVRDNFLYLVIFTSLIALWYGALQVLVGRRLRRADSGEELSRLIKFEATSFSTILVTIALAIPMGGRYYVSITWFFSAFFFCFALNNPFVSSRFAALTVSSPFAGWIVHSVLWSLLSGAPPHLPALAFCAIVAALLHYARYYFVRSRLDSSLGLVPAAGNPAIHPLDAFRDRFGLSVREGEVLSGILRGRITKEIAGELGIAEPTVKTHIARIFDKTGVRTRLELYGLYNQSALLPSGTSAGTTEPVPAQSCS